MPEGFCIQHGANVEIGPDRKCLTDGTYAIPPSTACCHRRWQDGTWSECRAPDASTNGQKRCKPYPADAWRSMLSQQERAEQKREHGRAANPYKAAPVPKRRTSEGTARSVIDHAVSRSHRPMTDCPVCSTPFYAKSQGDGRRQLTCSKACSKSWRPGGRPARPIVPCSICGTPFKARLNNDRRQIYCSTACQQSVAFPDVPRLQMMPCPVCSTPFKPRVVEGGGRRQKFCSPPCADRGQRRRQRALPVASGRQRLACLKCGTSFTARADSRGYCSVACGGKQATLLARPCEKCGEAFQPRKATRRFCSNACANSVRRKPVAA